MARETGDTRNVVYWEELGAVTLDSRNTGTYLCLAVYVLPSLSLFSLHRLFMSVNLNIYSQQFPSYGGTTLKMQRSFYSHE